MSTTTIPPITGTHPYAKKYPMLPDADLAELAEAIKTNGQRQPIVVTPDGLILDGRNRHAACERAGVKPTVEVYDGDDLAEYVIDCNTSRRHMSTGARAMSTALVLAADGRRTGGRWRRGSVAIGESPNSATWQAAVRDCGVILDHVPHLAEQVVDGSLALDAALRQAEQARDAERQKLEREQREQAEEAEARTFVEDNAPDLAARVNGDDLLSYREARDLWNRRNREEAERLRREKAEAERRAAEYDKAMRDLYSGMADALGVLGGYGGYDDITELMAEWRIDRLKSPQEARHFEAPNLRHVIAFAQNLITWQEIRA